MKPPLQKNSLTKFALLALFVIAGAGCATAPNPSLVNPGARVDPAIMDPAVMGTPGPSMEYDTPPKFVSGKAPVFPIVGPLGAKGGEALVEFTIGTDGLAHDIRVLQTTSSYLANQSTLAIATWRWKPAQKNGHPVAALARLPISMKGGIWAKGLAGLYQ